ncbi:MFS transporter [Providencia rettgeri]|uniref:MFS transporter n=1 Tax=Providencia rettgeri TaxID=587 RepID=UPI0023AB140B|nr:MFS transporter [Providencia rettgeri]ELR5152251.1 MFS transporter [Providencia rettgeri]
MKNKILASRFLSGISFYSFLPFYSLYLLNYKELTKEDVAIVLFVFLFVSRGFSLLSHYIIFSLGYKITFIMSYLLTSLAIAMTYLLSNFSSFIIFSAIIGAGFSIANICTSLYLAENSLHSNRMKNFSILNVIVNISSALGGVLGEFFYNKSYSGVILFPALIMFLSAIYLVGVKNNEKYNKSNNDKIRVSTSFSEWCVFVLYSAVSFFMIGVILRNLAYHYELYSKMEMEYISVSLLFALNAGVIITLQMKMTNFLAKKNLLTQNIVYKISLLLTVSVLFFLDFNSSINLYLLIGLFSLCELVWSPYNNSLSIIKCPFENKKMSLSLCVFFWGIAESCGAYFGLISELYQLKYVLPFFIIILLIFLFGFEHFLIKRNKYENDSFC